MEGPPLGPGGEDITWPDQVAPRGRKASSTRKIKPQTSNLVGLLVLLNPVGAEPFAGPVRPGPGPPPPLLEAEGKPFCPQPVLHGLQAVGGHVCAELEAPGHAAFALGVAVAVVLVPNQPTQ